MWAPLGEVGYAKDRSSEQRIGQLIIDKEPQIFDLPAANRVLDQVVESFFFEKPSKLAAVRSCWTFLSDLANNAVPDLACRWDPRADE
jgi:hypothetical protein